MNKTMTLIELLNKIANGEVVPKKIKINNIIYEYRGYMYCTEKANYQDIENYLFGKWNFNILNDTVEIIEDNDKTDEEAKPITKESIEALGYACGEIQKCFTSGWTKALENKPLKGNDKLEKININDNGTLGFPNGCWTARNMDKAFAIRINKIIDHINKIEEKLDER